MTYSAPFRRGNSQEHHMAKSQQRSTKETKKPKKEAANAKPLSPDAVTATITTVVPERSKKKK
jgi:hypothetical protein